MAPRPGRDTTRQRLANYTVVVYTERRALHSHFSRLSAPASFPAASRHEPPRASTARRAGDHFGRLTLTGSWKRWRTQRPVGLDYHEIECHHPHAVQECRPTLFGVIGGDFMAHTSIGNVLDALGVYAELDEGDLVCSAVVVLSILVPGERNPRLSIANSDGISWVEQCGLLRLAERITSEPPEEEA